MLLLCNATLAPTTAQCFVLFAAATYQADGGGKISAGFVTAQSDLSLWITCPPLRAEGYFLGSVVDDDAEREQTLEWS